MYLAAVPLTTEQLMEAAKQADRLTGRRDHGIFRPWTRVVDACP
ncbi:hypothetical protein [Actinoplanes sp. GCM10030250]